MNNIKSWCLADMHESYSCSAKNTCRTWQWIHCPRGDGWCFGWGTWTLFADNYSSLTRCSKLPTMWLTLFSPVILVFFLFHLLQFGVYWYFSVFPLHPLLDCSTQGQTLTWGFGLCWKYCKSHENCYGTLCPQPFGCHALCWALSHTCWSPWADKW